MTLKDRRYKEILKGDITPLKKGRLGGGVRKRRLIKRSEGSFVRDYLKIK